MKLANFNNDWYWKNYNTKGTAVRFFWYFTNLLFFKSTIPFPIKLKIFILQLFGAKIGEGCVIKPGVNIKFPWFLEIGDHVWIGENVWIDNLDQIKIGNNCCISQGALLLSGNHDYKSINFDLKIGPIILEEGVWIGAKAIVTQNVTCGKYSILSVASVTSTHLKAFGIYKGNPATFIRNREIKL